MTPNYGQNNRDSLYEMGLYYYDLSDKYEEFPDSCYLYTEMACKLFYESHHFYDFIDCQLSLISLNEYENKFDTIPFQFNEIISFAKKKLEFDNHLIHVLHLHEAYFYSYLGNYDKAIRAFNDALKHLEQVEDNQIELALLFNNYAVVSRKKGDLLKSIEYSKSAISIINIQSLHFRQKANYHFTLGITYQYLDSLEQSSKHYLIALKNANKADDELLKNKIIAKQLSICKKNCNNLINIIEKEYLRINNRHKYILSSSLGEYYLNKNENFKSEYYFERALNELEFNKNEDYHNLRIELLLKLSRIHLNNLALNKSSNYWNKAYSIFCSKHSIYSNNLNFLFFEIVDSKLDFLLRGSKVNKSVFNSQELIVLSLLKSFLQPLDYRLSNSSRLLILNNLHHLISTLLEKHKKFASLENFNFSLIETNKSFLLRNNTNNLTNIKNIDNPSLSQILKIQKQLALVESKPLNTKEKDLKRMSLKISYLADLDSILNSYTLSNPEYFNLKHNGFELSLKELQVNLNKENAILEYYVADSAIYQMIISRDTSIMVQIEELENLELKVKDILIKTREGKLNADELKNIYRLLFKSHNEYLKSFQNLIIIPDGFLHQLPFEILMDEEGNYLIENFNIEYQYSATLMYMLDQNNEQDKSVDGFAGFAYSSDNAELAKERSCNQSYNFDLLCSEKEVNQVSNILVKNDMPFNRTKSEFINNASNKSIIHLSTHACSDPEDYNLSRIYFEDDYITTYEISALNLNSDLAVLSACDTGSGAISKGEGVMSLAKSFFYAGCKSAIVSLWSVDDCSTSEIMVNFYKHLKSGKTKNNSLRLAKLDYLKSAHPERRAPYYWAGFILVGNNDALYSNDFNPWLWSVGSLILIGIVFFFYSKNKELRSEA